MNTPILHPYVIEKHEKLVAWNAYVIEYLGMRLEKRHVKGDYKLFDLYQGKMHIYQEYDFNLRRMTNVHMHRNLHTFLLNYMQAVKPLVRDNPDFMPPKL